MHVVTFRYKRKQDSNNGLIRKDYEHYLWFTKLCGRKTQTNPSANGFCVGWEICRGWPPKDVIEKELKTRENVMNDCYLLDKHCSQVFCLRSKCISVIV